MGIGEVKQERQTEGSSLKLQRIRACAIEKFSFQQQAEDYYIIAEDVNLAHYGKNQHAGLHKLWYPGIRDRSTWGKFGAHGEHGDVFLFSNLGAL